MYKWLYTKKGQSTGEYALIFAIVLGAAIAMQTYVKRELQGRMKDGTDYMARETAVTGGFALSPVPQYEPYYYVSDYTTERNRNEQEDYQTGGAYSNVLTGELTTRQAGGFTGYNAPLDQGITGGN
ncbi:MAG: hypothetical protein V1662_01845 [Candidatus Omnitrophota bacterium]